MNKTRKIFNYWMDEYARIWEENAVNADHARGIRHAVEVSKSYFLLASSCENIPVDELPEDLKHLFNDET